MRIEERVPRIAIAARHRITAELTRILVLGIFLCGLTVWSGPGTASAAVSAQDPKHFIVDVIAISGEEFVVKDEAGTEGKIHVGTDTEKFGHIQPGDRIDAWVLPNGHAKTIMILRSAAFIRLEQDRGQAPESSPR